VITNSKFSPRWWLRNPHFLDINWSKKTSGSFVCIFHGLAGSIESAYVKAVFTDLEDHGFRPVFMHWRSCSGEPNRLARSYHSGTTDDIHRLFKLVQYRYPATPLFAIAYSLGANALLKYLGEQSSDCQLVGAVCVCPPLVLSVGADKLNTGLAKGYQKYLITPMRAQHEAKRKKYPELNLPPATSELNNFWKFDDALTAPLHGFRDVHDYYEKCSARQYLPAIDTNTHIIYALDDPFFTKAVLPDDSELSAHITLELSKYGGHVGFIGDTRDSNWLSKRICSALKAFQNTL